MKTAKKWIIEERKYVPYELPEGSTCYENDMKKIISCCSCGKKITYGESYTSKQIHTEHGIGYAECSECYEEYFNKEREINK